MSNRLLVSSISASISVKRIQKSSKGWQSVRLISSSTTSIRQSLDDEPKWKSEWRLDKGGASQATGLFDYPQLVNPENGFITAAQSAVSQAEALIRLIQSASGNLIEMRKTIQRMDRMSDILCSVVDAAELARNIHPSRAVAQSANRAHSYIAQYLNQLNTNPTLYHALKEALEDPSISADLGIEERRVGELLLADFCKSGIQLPEQQRKQFVALNDAILEHGKAFAEHCSYGFKISAVPGNMIKVDNPSVRLAGVPNKIVSRWMQSSKSGDAFIPLQGHGAASLILNTCSNEETRRMFYALMHTPVDDQVERLEKMLHFRRQLANLLGSKSYSHLRVHDLMAESPENVKEFLTSQIQLIKTKYATKLQSLIPENAHDIDLSSLAFLTARHSSQSHNSGELTFSDIKAFFSLGTVFEALCKLIYNLYGVFLEIAPLKQGEVWDESVRKFRVVDSKRNLLGVLYCDFFQRQFNGAAHFTVRCSRRTDIDEPILGGADPVLSCSHLESPAVDPVSGVTKRFNLPLVVLVTGFERPHGSKPCLLSLEEVGILYHEMGHVIHSMLSRTQFQHISGTRVQADFVEFPSQFMEMFIKSPEYLYSIASHYKEESDVSKPNVAKFEALLKTRESSMLFGQYNTALLSLADQLYHSDEISDHSHGYTTSVYERIATNYGLFPSFPAISPPCGLPHLFSYGSTYYSYLWAQNLVDRVWVDHFQGKAPESWGEGGELIKKELIGLGGSRSAWDGFARLGVFPTSFSRVK